MIQIINLDDGKPVEICGIPYHCAVLILKAYREQGRLFNDIYDAIQYGYSMAVKDMKKNIELQVEVVCKRGDE